MKELRKLPMTTQERLAEAIGLLGANPSNAQLNITTLTNDFEARFRLRVGRYRIKFNKNDVNKTIQIIKIADRKDVYR